MHNTKKIIDDSSILKKINMILVQKNAFRIMERTSFYGKKLKVEENRTQFLKGNPVNLSTQESYDIKSELMSNC